MEVGQRFFVLVGFGSPDVDCVDGDWSVVRADSEEVEERNGQPVGGVSAPWGPLDLGKVRPPGRHGL